jgi:hypothetical protein
VPSLVKIGPVVLEKKSKMWKVYRQTDDKRQTPDDRQTDRRTTDKKRSEKLTWAFSSGELKTIILSTPDHPIFDLFVVHNIPIDYIISHIKLCDFFELIFNYFMNISSVIMNTSINSLHEKKKMIRNMINAAWFVRGVIGLKCTLYIVKVWNLEGLFPGRETHTHKHKTHVFLGFTISCMFARYNSHRNSFRFLSLSKLHHPRKHHLLTGDDKFYWNSTSCIV